MITNIRHLMTKKRERYSRVSRIIDTRYSAMKPVTQLKVHKGNDVTQLYGWGTNGKWNNASSKARL